MGEPATICGDSMNIAWRKPHKRDTPSATCLIEIVASRCASYACWVFTRQLQWELNLPFHPLLVTWANVWSFRQARSFFVSCWLVLVRFDMISRASMSFVEPPWSDSTASGIIPSGGNLCMRWLACPRTERHLDSAVALSQRPCSTNSPSFRPWLHQCPFFKLIQNIAEASTPHELIALFYH